MVGKYLDEETLIAIFDEFAPALYKYALRLCHDTRRADNIVGDAFAQLVEGFATGKAVGSNPRLYLYQAAYSSIVKYLRDSQPGPSAEPVVSASDQSHSQDDREALFSALKNELTEAQRHVVILYFLEDFNTKETAEILDKGVRAIRASLEDIGMIIENHPASIQTDSLAALWIIKIRKRKPK